MPVSGREPDLSWLADAPVFIDGQQIGAFYDAVVGRGFRAVQLQLSAGQTEQLERSAGGSVAAGSSALFSWLKFDAGAEAHKTKSRGRQEGQSVVLEPVKSVDATGSADPALHGQPTGPHLRGDPGNRSAGS
jgi:hypothetical protein